MLLIENGKVKAVGTALSIPKNALIVDFKGKHIYPSFVELHSGFGIAAVKVPPDAGGWLRPSGRPSGRASAGPSPDLQ